MGGLLERITEKKGKEGWRKRERVSEKERERERERESEGASESVRADVCIHNVTWAELIKTAFV